MLSFLAIAGSAAAYNANVSTEVVTAYTTFCPSATTFVEGTSTYTATGPTTITVTDCPCTRTHTFSTHTVTVCGTASPAPSGDSPSLAASPVPNNSTAPGLANGANTQGLSSAAAAVGAVVIANFL